MSVEPEDLSDEAKARCKAISDCLRVSGKGRCYPNGNPVFDDPDLVLDPEVNCIGPKPGRPCDREREDLPWKMWVGGANGPTVPPSPDKPGFYRCRWYHFPEKEWTQEVIVPGNVWFQAAVEWRPLHEGEG